MVTFLTVLAYTFLSVPAALLVLFSLTLTLLVGAAAWAAVATALYYIYKLIRIIWR